MKDRVLELRRVRAGDLAPNPANWRTHPESQRAAYRELVADVGFTGACVGRERDDGKVELLDGHMRLEEAMPDDELPVLLVDLDDDEAAIVLATYDPLGQAATIDGDRAAQLLESIDPSDAVAKLLKGVAVRAHSRKLQPGDKLLVPAWRVGAPGPGYYLRPSARAKSGFMVEWLKIEVDDDQYRFGPIPPNPSAGGTP